MLKLKVLLIAFGLALAPLAGAAQSESPLIRVMVRPISAVPADHPLAPAAVTAAVGRIVAARGYRWEPLSGAALPVGSTVIRVLYIVTEQTTDGAPVVAASAATQLLQAGDIGGGKLVLSLYSGVQQNLSQLPDLSAARAEVTDLFVAELRERINDALGHLETLRY